MLSIIACVYYPSLCLLRTNICLGLLPTFNWVVCFPWIEIHELFVYFGDQSFGSCYHLLFLFLFLINYCNWRLITLQYCGGFCHASAWISHGCICVPTSWVSLPPFSPPYPSGLSHSTSFGCPVLCIKLEMVIYFTYGNIHVSMLFSNIVPPSPSTPEVYSYNPYYKILLFTSGSLLLSCI